MARKKISSLRRDELIQSAICAISEHGFADLTVSQIAKNSEASTGSIHYYFGGKEALLEATMRHLLSLLMAAHLRHLGHAGNAEERLHAVVQANFDPTFLTRETCRVWTQFWAFAPYRPKLARLHQINRARVRSNVVHSLRELVPEAELRVTTNAIQGYMDGVWIQVTQSDKKLNLNELQSEATRFVNRTIAKAVTA